jgi:hypothetical protein
VLFLGQKKLFYSITAIITAIPIIMPRYYPHDITAMMDSVRQLPRDNDFSPKIRSGGGMSESEIIE